MRVDKLPESFAGRLLRRRCPWGGHLVRLSLRGLDVHDPPADTSYLFVRPEVRAWAARTCPELKEELFEVVQQLAPGDAVLAGVCDAEI